MNDSDHRPMPVEVQHTYRDPIDLLGLLQSAAYGDEDRENVRDALMGSLFEKHGDAWIEAGGKEVSVSMHVRSFRSSAVRSIKMLIDVPDYGGRDETLPILALAMQPRWSQWWDGFVWNGSAWDGNENIAGTWREVSLHVLGNQQFRWLAAQYARTTVHLTRSQDRGACVRAIEAAEALARSPSRDNIARSDQSAISVYRSSDIEERTDSSYAAYAAYCAAAYASDDDKADRTAQSAHAAGAAAYSAARAARAAGDSSHFAGLEALTKKLIMPTLITRASRGLYASGAMHRASKPAAIGAIVGAGTMFLAKRA